MCSSGTMTVFKNPDSLHGKAARVRKGVFVSFEFRRSVPPAHLSYGFCRDIYLLPWEYTSSH